MTRADIESAAASIPAGAEAVRVTDADGQAWTVFRDGSFSTWAPPGVRAAN